MLTALLNNLPGFFNRDPQADLALRVRHPAGLRWNITCADLLTLSPAGLTETRLDLRPYTVNALAAYLRTLGFEVPYCNPSLAARQASILLPGSGDQDKSNGDHLYGFRSILWAHLKALDIALADADLALAAMLRQLILPHAKETWADYWGYHFGMPRLTGETDSAYTQRIIDEFYRARNNPVAMKKNVKRYTGADIELFEPWTQMWTLDQSRLSGNDGHLPSGNFYAYHWLQPIARQLGIDWQKILPVLNADRPAGTLLADPAYWLPPFYVDCGSGDHAIDSAADHTRTHRVWLMDCGVLDVNLVLSAHCIKRNYQASVFEWYTRNIAGLQTDIASMAGRRTFCRGEIVLSVAPPLGDRQAHFPGRRWIEVGDPLRLSEDGLSDYQSGGYWQAIDEWLWNNHASDLNEWLPTGIHSTQQDTRAVWFQPEIRWPRLSAEQRDPIWRTHSRRDLWIGNGLLVAPRTWHTGQWDTALWAHATALPFIQVGLPRHNDASLLYLSNDPLSNPDRPLPPEGWQLQSSDLDMLLTPTVFLDYADNPLPPGTEWPALSDRASLDGRAWFVSDLDMLLTPTVFLDYADNPLPPGTEWPALSDRASLDGRAWFVSDLDMLLTPTVSGDYADNPLPPGTEWPDLSETWSSNQS